jgi:nitrous oxide reductase accessory protein NosL
MVIAEIAGKEVRACCPRCAISEANQEQKALRLIEVHDYQSGKGISPANAWFVEGSRVIACTHDMTRMGEHKDMQDMAFDRCSPSTLAFANKPDADAFIAQNGGTVLSFGQLMSEAKFQ